MSEPVSRVREFVLDVDGIDEPFTFRVSQADFGRFLREAQRDVALAANNLLLGASVERERLKAAFEADWGLALQLLAPIAEELTPARSVTVKKR